MNGEPTALSIIRTSGLEGREGGREIEIVRVLSIERIMSVK